MRFRIYPVRKWKSRPLIGVDIELRLNRVG